MDYPQPIESRGPATRAFVAPDIGIEPMLRLVQRRSCRCHQPGDECERRLGQHTIGRVVMSQLARRTNVAFEVDGLDEQARTGWSVVVRGTAERVVQNYDLLELWTKARPVPWAAGERTMHIAITPRAVTGREVSAR
jgi:Pyridoxamine 5'-phosphate oxidase